MARMPGATWIGPTPNMHPNGMLAHKGLVLHIQQGTEAGSESWFKNPESQASAHFLNPKSGGLRQLVDTDDRAWAEMKGNWYWVSIENEGLSGQSLTASQVENAAQLFAWLHKMYNVPLQSTDDPNGTGLGWHGMGGAAWGGHYDCPGDPIKAQRPQIIARAKEILGEKTPPPPTKTIPAFPGRQYFKDGANNRYVTQLGQQLVKKGFGKHYVSGPGPRWSDADRRNVQDFQRSRKELAGDADGYPGPLTWKLLFS
jgi:hypothetical protein